MGCLERTLQRVKALTDTAFAFTFLQIGTRIQPRQVGNSRQLISSRFVLMLKHTSIILLGTWSAKVVVVAELIVLGTTLNFF